MGISLDQALAKAGLESNDKKGAKKTKMVTVATDKAMASKIDRYLELQDVIDNATAESKAATADIREFAYGYVVKNKETENIILSGTKGEINVNFKDQYTNLDAERAEELRKALVAKDINPERHIKEESEVKFDFNALTDSEREALVGFLSNTLGMDRYKQVVTTKTVYKVTGLKDEMITKCNTVEEFQELRSLSSHYDATVARRK